MANCIDFSGRPFHFIGIGGIGMSAIAHILARRQLPISGSDIRLNHITERLQDQGAHIFMTQKADNLKFFQPDQDTFSASGSVILSSVAISQPESEVPSSANDFDQGLSHSCLLPQVICSTAIHPDNPEYNAARTMGCPIFHRSDVLAALVNHSQGIAVAGTHGKTTTSSMIGYVLLQVGLDPSIVVGGEVDAWNGNARLGDGDFLVAEADESDGSLVKFAPKVGVITNIEWDHPDHYQSLAEVVDTFKTFAHNCETLVSCADCANISNYLESTVTYSLRIDSGATYRADQIVYEATGTRALIWERDVLLGELWLPVLGEHNLSNALAAVAVARLVGIEFNAIATAFRSFRGARRRFENYGVYHNIMFVDDYAHHPSEIQATLAAARLQAQGVGLRDTNGRVIAVFQPHRYSRATMFIDEFAQSFSSSDVVLVTEVYSAGETPGDINGQCIAEAIAAHHSEVYYRSTLPDVSALLKQTLQPGDLVVFLGAGNLNRIIPDLIDFYQHADVSTLFSRFSQIAS